VIEATSSILSNSTFAVIKLLLKNPKQKDRKELNNLLHNIREFKERENLIACLLRNIRSDKIFTIKIYKIPMRYHKYIAQINKTKTPNTIEKRNKAINGPCELDSLMLIENQVNLIKPMVEKMQPFFHNQIDRIRANSNISAIKIRFFRTNVYDVLLKAWSFDGGYIEHYSKYMDLIIDKQTKTIRLVDDFFIPYKFQFIQRPKNPKRFDLLKNNDTAYLINYIENAANHLDYTEEKLHDFIHSPRTFKPLYL
jgi:hypothetical protein